MRRIPVGLIEEGSVGRTAQGRARAEGTVYAMVAVLLALLPLSPPRAYADAAPDLSIFKGHSGGFFVGSTTATYSFSVSNGPSAGPTTGAITLTDTLPTGITYNSISGPTSGWSCSGTT